MLPHLSTFCQSPSVPAWLVPLSPSSPGVPVSPLGSVCLEGQLAGSPAQCPARDRLSARVRGMDECGVGCERTPTEPACAQEWWLFLLRG